MTWHRIAYVAACIVVPLAWGLVVVWVSNRLDGWTHRRRGGADSGNPIHPEKSTMVEYHI